MIQDILRERDALSFYILSSKIEIFKATINGVIKQYYYRHNLAFLT